MKRTIYWRLLSCILVLLNICAIVPIIAKGQEALPISVENEVASENLLSYNDYLAQYANHSNCGKQSISINGGTYIQLSGSAEGKDEYKDEKGVVLLGKEQASVSYKFAAPITGMYHISIYYRPFTGDTFLQKSKIGLSLDEKTLFKGMDELYLTRPWHDTAARTTDMRGNEIAAVQEECKNWLWQSICDSNGSQEDLYCFYLEKGEHTVAISGYEANIAISKIQLYQTEKALTYKEKSQEYESIQDDSDFMLYVQAEDYSRKSDSTISTDTDKSDPATMPIDSEKFLLNIISGATYKNAGQWIEWKVEIPSSGYYKFAFRCRQNSKSGFFSTRSLTVDGETPFAECEDIRFNYKSDWYMKNLGDESQPYLVYLSEGEHTLRLESVAGVYGDISQVMNDCLYRLNTVHNHVVMVAGTEPDIYRDYKLNVELPELSVEIHSLLELLKEQEQSMIEISGKTGSELSSIRALINLMTIFENNLDKIPSQMDTFRSYIESLASWNSTLVEQPLDLDYIFISSAEVETPEATSSFWNKVIFSINKLIASYKKDYGVIGDYSTDDNQAITVWVDGARDQLKVLKSLIDNRFTLVNSTKVNLAITPTSLNSAVLAGTGPDVSLFVAGDVPVTLASKNALVDLTQFVDFGEIESCYFEGTTTPFYYQGGCYGIPLTETFPMMFVRTDIFENLGLEIPQTWDDMYQTVAVLQRKNMDFALPSNFGTFSTMLYQNGGTLFNENQSKVLLNSQESIKAFKNWTDFFAKYSFPISYSFYNRFRSGQMPIGIEDYTLYATLKIAAPEIRNQWVMVPLPGVLKNDGTIDRTITISNSTGTGAISGLSQTVTAAVIIKSASNKETSFEFIKWFAKAETQAEYGQNIEAILGVAGRYSPANVEAFKRLPWTETEKSTLLQSWGHVKTMEEIPGNYYIARYINTGFRSVIYENLNPVDILNKYTNLINKEISRKRIEYAIDDANS